MDAGNEASMLDELGCYLAAHRFLTPKPVVFFDALCSREDRMWRLDELLATFGSKLYQRRKSRRADAPRRAVCNLATNLNLRIAKWCRGEGRRWQRDISIEWSSDNPRLIYWLWVRPAPRRSRRRIQLNKPQRIQLRHYLEELNRYLTLRKSSASLGRLLVAEVCANQLRRLLGLLVRRPPEESG